MRYLFLMLLCLVQRSVAGQTHSEKLYSPTADAEKEIAGVIKQAKAQKRMIMLQVGGNWCSWCYEFNKLCTSDNQVDSLLRSDFLVYHLNYSPENKNTVLLARYGYPQRFGFPVFLILDENGNRVHTQNSSYLEQGRSYNKKKVMEFLSQWNRNAVNPGSYKNQ